MTRREKEPQECSVDGCDADVLAKGLCGLHYGRMRHHNSTDDPRGPGPEPIDGEQWKCVPVREYSDTYEVSDRGRIRRTATGRVRRPCQLKSGYQIVTLSRKSRAHTYLVHRLVALAFLGEPPTDDHEVNHCDGVKANCAVDNLEWATRSENIRHAFRIGLRDGAPPPPRHRGATHPKAKLRPADVLEIRASTETRTALAARYGVSQSTIKAVRRKNAVNWAWLESDPQLEGAIT